jgi:hypothetical protein
MVNSDTPSETLSIETETPELEVMGRFVEAFVEVDPLL